jgi:hypothetical protein
MPLEAWSPALSRLDLNLSLGRMSAINMSYKIEISEGKALPVIICDQCGGRIETLKDGNALWLETVTKRRDKPRLYDLSHTHKRCNDQFEAANPAESDQQWMSHELPDDLFLLLKNVGYDPKSAARKSRQT